jgi:NAD(P)-dependent dehydrogenase (short-subunit alcohol dehydrogenase family)
MNMNDYPNFNDKVALVTGASSGIGLATALAFAEAGASVTLADVKEEAVREAAEKLINAGHRALAIPCTSATTLRWKRWSSERSPNLADWTRPSTMPA